MSAVRAYVLWRLKPDIEIKKEDLTYFSPGGYCFTHKSGKHIDFDFEEHASGFMQDNGYLETNHKEIENDIITSNLKENNNDELIQEQYDIEFFKNGTINLDDKKDEIYLCMDINGEEVEAEKFVEPVYLAVFDPYNPTECVELYNKLTPEEYKKYCGEEEER